MILGPKIASGGMADVYIGKLTGDDSFARICCVKKVLHEHLKNPEIVNMFRDEAQLGKFLQHANIIRIESFETLDDTFALILEYINGIDLRRLLDLSRHKKLSIPIPICLYIIAEVARGLHFAHTRTDDQTQTPLHIIHRDISIHNIMVSFFGEVKLGDFGVAYTSHKRAQTQIGTVKGKIAYMSPEQIQGKQLTPASDIFSLGIVLCEILTSHNLFLGTNDAETIQNIINSNPEQLLSSKLLNFDTGLQSILNKSLALNPQDRFPNAEAMEQSLRLYLNQAYSRFTPNIVAKYLQTFDPESFTKNQELIKKILGEKTFPGIDIQNNTEIKLAKPEANEAQKYSPIKKPRIIPLSREDDTLYKPIKPNRPFHLLFNFLIVVVCCCGVGLLWYINSPSEVQLITSPSQVNIWLDQNFVTLDTYEDWQTTPMVFKQLKIGQSHKIKLAHPSYNPAECIFFIHSFKQTVKCVLQSREDNYPVFMVLKKSEVKEVHITIKEAFFKSYLTAQYPQRFDDFLLKTPYTAVLEDQTTKAHLFNCQFILNAKSPKPMWLVVDLHNQVCNFFMGP